MIKIVCEKRKSGYIEKYGIDKVFSHDMKPHMELFMYRKGEFICKETEEIRYLYFLVEGKVKVSTPLSNGKTLLLCFYEGFQVLGDLEITMREKASTNVQVIEDAYLIAISFEAARALLLNDARFLRFISQSLGQKLIRCSKNSSINLLFPLESRLASYIMAAGKKTGCGEGERLIFSENLTEIAELLGTSYRHLLRTLNALVQKGILEKKGDWLEVSDERQLKLLAADLYK